MLPELDDNGKALSLGQRRVLEAARARREQDARDQLAHPAEMALEDEVNAVCNFHVKAVPLLLAAACEEKEVVTHLMAVGALFQTEHKVAEATQRQRELEELVQQQQHTDAALVTRRLALTSLNTQIDQGEGQVQALRKQLQDCAANNEKQKVRVSQALAEKQRSIRELRVAKVDLRHEVEELEELKGKQARDIPIATTLVETLQGSLGDHASATPLHLACLYGKPFMVSQLISREAVPHARDIEGQTPLHLAAAQGNPECIQMFTALLPPAALTRCLSALNSRGQRPSDLASDPACRQALAKAALAAGKRIRSPWMRGGLPEGEEVGDTALDHDEPPAARAYASYITPFSCPPFNANKLPAGREWE